MQDEAPEGRPTNGEHAGLPGGTRRPMPETPDDEAAGSGDAVVLGDETMSFPIEVQATAQSMAVVPEATPVAVPDVTPVVAPATAAVALAGEAPATVRAADSPRPPNEAIPAVPPRAGTGPIGSIPAARARAVWSRLQASNWRLFLIRLLSAGLAVVVTVVVLPGLGFSGWRWGDFTRIALIFGLLNATVKPLLQFLVLRFIFSTYGIVVVMINALLLLLLGAILDDTFEAYRPVSLLAGGLVVGILGLIFETLLGATPPVLDRDYKEGNGLS